MKILGVDLGSYSVKIAELDVTAKGYIFSAFHELPLSPDPTRDRSLEIIETLRGFSSKYDPQTTRWVMGLSQHRVSVHHKRFPFRERLKILKSLPFELEDEIPLEIDETVYEAKIVEYVGQTSDVLTIASPKEAVIEALNTSRDGGFDPEIISVEGLALSNIFENWNSPPPEVVPALRQNEEVTSIGVTASLSARLVLHLGHTRSLLLVYREGALIACRSILWGGNEIASALARAFSLPPHEAIKILKTKSFILMNPAGASKDQLLMSQTVALSLDQLLREVRLSLLEVKAAFNLQFKSMELLGGVSLIQNAGAYITQVLEIPTNLARHLGSHKQVRVEATPQLEATSAVALGLAIEALKKPRNPPVNLRKQEFERENPAFKLFWDRWRVPIQAAAVAFCLFVAYSFMRDSIATGLAEVATERLTEVARSEAGLRGAAALPSGVRTHITRQNRLLDMRGDLQEMNDYVSAMDILARLSEKLPVITPPAAGRGLDITLLSIENDDLTIQGRAQGTDLIPQIEVALKGLNASKTLAKLTPDSVPNGPGTKFGYRIKVKRK